MPRMSIDDEFRHDPRVLRLAKACGWSRRETMGCLFDIWACNYERASEFLPEADIDAIAELDGFTRNLIACDLARDTKRGVRIAGAKERIRYLKQKRDAGSRGGLKSGESRRKSAKHPLRAASPPLPAASSETNPSANASAPDLVPDPERESESSPAPPKLSLVPPPAWVPEWTGALEHARSTALARGVDVEAAVTTFGAYADSKQWPLAERPGRLVAWLTRERTPSAKERAARLDAKPRPKPKPDTPPPNCVPLTDEERDEVRRLAERVANNPIAAATALKELQ